jgi:hypothetical protein
MSNTTNNQENGSTFMALVKVAVGLFLLFVGSQGLFAQTTYAEAYGLKGEVVTDEGKSYGNMYISIDKEGKHFLNFRSKNKIETLPKYSNFIKDSYSKYLEWKATAESNNVTDMQKDIMSTTVGDGVSFIYGKWHFSFTPIQATSRFYVLEDGTTQFVIYFPKVKSSSNRYIESSRQYLTFSSEEEVNAYLDMLDLTTISEFLKEKKQSAVLFN